jgi:hypothetical protein
MGKTYGMNEEGKDINDIFVIPPKTKKKFLWISGINGRIIF